MVSDWPPEWRTDTGSRTPFPETDPPPGADIAFRWTPTSALATPRVHSAAGASDLAPARGARAGAHPLVGVPDPIAIAKTCSAVIPLPTPALTVGSVTDATVFPACNGTDAK
jgi:hypothetical protein